jgi:diketogulonate reductase-like aldo/keto reductase
MIGWGIQRCAVVSPKSVHRDRTIENAAIFDFSLSDKGLCALDALDRTGGTGRRLSGFGPTRYAAERRFAATVGP